MNNKKGKVFYVAIAIIIIFLLNYFVLPMLLGDGIKDTTYDEFLSALNNGSISEVQIQEDSIIYTLKEEKFQNGSSIIDFSFSNSEKVYRTGLMDDPKLV